jgi:hypothetical protein
MITFKKKLNFYFFLFKIIFLILLKAKKQMYVDMLIKNITPKECVIIVTIKKVEPENLGFVNMKFIMLKGFARIVI